MTDNRLTNEGITIDQMVEMSYTYYQKHGAIKYKSDDPKYVSKYDNKWDRAKIDVKRAVVNRRQNFEYDRNEKRWVQTGRDIKIEFTVVSVPTSYKKTDTISKHTYPVTFIIHNLNRGIYSTFKWRTGSLKKPIFIKPGLTSQQVAEKNIRNQVQMQFFFDLEYVAKMNNVLYGKCWANRPPLKTNPKNELFFDKHAWFIVYNFLIKLIGANGGAIIGKYSHWDK